MSDTIGHNGKTGWVCNPRCEERAVKRSERQRVLELAWEEAMDDEVMAVRDRRRSLAVR